MQDKNEQSSGCSHNDELLIDGCSLESWSIIDRFEYIVHQHPQRIAVVSGDDRLTYTQLNARANQVAHALVDAGIEFEEPVGIAIPKSSDLIAGVLGILKAGGAYVPFVDNQPVARLKNMRAQAMCRVILGQHGYLDKLHTKDCCKITEDQWNSLSTENLGVDRTCNQLAYILFTSGSTGTPKGVMIADAGVIRLVCGQSYLPFGPEFHYLFAAPMSFDVSTLEIFTPLLHGAKLVVVPDGEPDPQSIRDLCHQEQVKSTCMAFGLFSSLFESCPELFEQMPIVAVGGEKVLWDGIANAQMRLPSTQFINAYGPTEATMLATTFAIPTLGTEGGVVPIGKPLDRMCALVLNDQLEEVDEGEQGELCLGGVGIARGYVGLENQTQDRFVFGPADAAEKQRLYRTGDLVYKDENGDMVFVGRQDDQIKIHGYRIELGEIESIALEEKGVSQAVAVMIDDGDHQRIGLAVVGSPTHYDEHNLRSCLADRLPSYMMPGFLHSIERVPLNRNGKVDRKATAALLEKVEPKGIACNAHQELKTSTEKWLGQVVGELLGIDQVYADDSFLHLGGHSLRAVVLCSRIRDRYQQSLRISMLYQQRTIQAISSWIDQQVDSGVNAGDVLLFHTQDKGVLAPLSFNQQRLWVLSQLEPDDTSYTITVRMIHKGKFDRACFERAFDGLCSRHDVLRSRICLVDGVPHQLVDEDLDLRVRWVSCLGDNDENVCRKIEVASENGFDLEAGPLVRCSVYLQDDEASVVISMHHIISDAWSCDVVQRDLNQAYNACIQAEKIEWDALPVQYADFARWQRSLPSTARYAEDLSYWKEKLDGFEAVEIPLDVPRGAKPSSNGHRVSQTVDSGTVKNIQASANELGTTTYTYMLSLFQIWIHRLTGSDDIVIGTPIANREWTQVEGLVGFFMETAALRTQVCSGDSFRSVVGRVSETVLEAFDHRDVPFQHIVDAVHAHAVDGRNPLFEVFFNQVVLDTSSDTHSGELVFAQDQIDNHTAKFDLTCYLFQKEDAIEVVFNYREELFEQETVEWFLEQYMSLIRVGHEHLNTSVSQLPIHCSDALFEHEQLADGIYMPSGCSIHEHVNRIAVQYPDNIAVSWESNTLSYAKLWEQSGQVVSMLKDQGVKQGDRVFVSIADAGLMATTILGILRRGAVYIPLDPSWPDQRIGQIVQSVCTVHAMVDETMADRLNGFGLYGYVVRVDQLALEKLNPASERDAFIELNAPAYMLFTSGSTGEPKGVVQSHHGVVAHMHTFADSVELTQSDCVLQLSSNAFDSAIMDMFGAWFVGATLRVCDIQREDAANIHAAINTNHVTVFHSAPSVYRWFTDSLLASDQCPSVRAVVLGGEPLGASIVENLLRSFPNCSLLINGMGLTESSLTLQMKLHPKDIHNLSRWIPVGFPVAGTQVRLVDKDGLQTGLAGEIEIESDHLALGYWNGIHKPLLPIGLGVQGTRRKRMRTGDRGMMRADGAIVHMGRVDRQVQVHGCRVEVGEIEAVLRQVPGVFDVAVLAHQTNTGDHTLCSYVVVGDSLKSHTLTTSLLRNHLASRLPGYLVPRDWKRVEAIPYTGSGKVHRLALLESRELSFEISNEVDSRSESPTAIMVLTAFKQVLDTSDIGLDDCLFKLGGNSLKAIRVFAILREQCKTSLPVSTIYTSSTPRAIAIAIDEHASDQGSKSLSNVVCYDLGGNTKGSPVYFIPGIGGQPMGFRPMIDLLDSNRRYIGLQLPSVEQLEKIGKTLQALAGWLIEQMELESTERAPDIVGYSFGGALAFEIALQLQQKGFEGGSLFLLDAHLPSGLPKKGRLGATIVHMKNVLLGGEHGRIGYLRSKVLNQRIHTPTQSLNSSSEQKELRPFKLNAKANRKMLGSYVPTSSYAGPICLLKAIQPSWLQFHKDDEYNGWASFININHTQVANVNATHLELFKPGAVEEIASTTDLWLDVSTHQVS